jgi:hypothetical protein
MSDFAYFKPELRNFTKGEKLELTLSDFDPLLGTVASFSPGWK